MSSFLFQVIEKCALLYFDLGCEKKHKPASESCQTLCPQCSQDIYLKEAIVVKN